MFATDKILSTLMCAPRSVYSWDVVVHKVGGKLFLDQRDASFDLLTVRKRRERGDGEDGGMAGDGGGVGRVIEEKRKVEKGRKGEREEDEGWRLGVGGWVSLGPPSRQWSTHEDSVPLCHEMHTQEKQVKQESGSGRGLELFLGCGFR